MLKQISDKNALIHCITNPISINDCANLVLAFGAKPIMAAHPQEVEEITKNAQALALNLGNFEDVRAQSMRLSARSAKEHGIPCILDMVGVACSAIRLQFAREIVETSLFPPLRRFFFSRCVFCSISGSVLWCMR